MEKEGVEAKADDNEDSKPAMPVNVKQTNESDGDGMGKRKANIQLKTTKKAGQSSSNGSKSPTVNLEACIPKEIRANWKKQIHTVKKAQCPECRSIRPSYCTMVRHFSGTHPQLLEKSATQTPPSGKSGNEMDTSSTEEATIQNDVNQSTKQSHKMKHTVHGADQDQVQKAYSTENDPRVITSMVQPDPVAPILNLLELVEEVLLSDTKMPNEIDAEFVNKVNTIEVGPLEDGTEFVNKVNTIEVDPQEVGTEFVNKAQSIEGGATVVDAEFVNETNEIYGLSEFVNNGNGDVSTKICEPSCGNDNILDAGKVNNEMDTVSGLNATPKGKGRGREKLSEPVAKDVEALRKNVGSDDAESPSTGKRKGSRKSTADVTKKGDSNVEDNKMDLDMKDSQPIRRGGQTSTGSVLKESEPIVDCTGDEIVKTKTSGRDAVGSRRGGRRSTGQNSKARDIATERSETDEICQESGSDPALKGRMKGGRKSKGKTSEGAETAAASKENDEEVEASRGTTVQKGRGKGGRKSASTVSKGIVDSDEIDKEHDPSGDDVRPSRGRGVRRSTGPVLKDTETVKSSEIGTTVETGEDDDRHLGKRGGRKKPFETSQNDHVSGVTSPSGRPRRNASRLTKYQDSDSEDEFSKPKGHGRQKRLRDEDGETADVTTLMGRDSLKKRKLTQDSDDKESDRSMEMVLTPSQTRRILPGGRNSPSKEHENVEENSDIESEVSVEFKTPRERCSRRGGQTPRMESPKIDFDVRKPLGRSTPRIRGRGVGCRVRGGRTQIPRSDSPSIDPDVFVDLLYQGNSGERDDVSEGGHRGSRSGHHGSRSLNRGSRGRSHGPSGRCPVSHLKDTQSSDEGSKERDDLDVPDKSSKGLRIEGVPNDIMLTWVKQSGKAYKCPKCSTKQKEFKLIVEHYITKCKDVEVEVPTTVKGVPPNVIKNWRARSKSSFVCPKCKQVRRSFNAAVEHYKQCKITDGYKCPICPERSFTSFPGIRYHMMADHARVILINNLEGSSDDEHLQTIIMKFGWLRCDKCREKMVSIKRFHFHREWCGREKERSTCERCQKVVPLFKMRAHEKAHQRLDRMNPEGSNQPILDKMEIIFTSDEEKADAEVEDEGPPKKRVRKAAKKAQKTLKDINRDRNLENDDPSIVGDWSDYYTSPELLQLSEKELEKAKEAFKDNEEYQCPHEGCDKMLATKISLTYHYTRCLAMKDPPIISYKCKKCAKELTTVSNIRRHVVKCFDLNTVPRSQPVEDPEDPDANLEAEDESDDDVSSGVPEDLSSEEEKSRRKDGDRKRRKKMKKKLDVKIKNESDGKFGARMQYPMRREADKKFLWADSFLYDEMKAYVQKYYRDAVFQDIMPRKEHWDSIPMVSLEMSALQKLGSMTKFQIKQEKTKTILKEFGTLPLNEPCLTGSNVTMNVGGPVYAADWCPVPLSAGSTDQYLAVAPIQGEVPYMKVVVQTGTIQLWNCGKLGKGPPNIALSLLMVHNFGNVFQMMWCPSGAWCPVDAEQKVPQRLGLLALACSDGTVRILSVPHPETLEQDPSNQNAYKIKAAITLERCLENVRSHTCTCIDWSKTDGHETIVAGFSDGAVALWDLATTSPLLRSENEATGEQTILPYRTFYAHQTVVTCLCFCPEDSNLLLTSSMIHFIYMWNIKDMAGPIRAMRRGYQTALLWPPHLGAFFFGQDDCFCVTKIHGTYMTNVHDDDGLRTLQSMSTVYSIDRSPWTDFVVQGNISGEVTAHIGKVDRKTSHMKRGWVTKFVQVEKSPEITSKSSAKDMEFFGTNDKVTAARDENAMETETAKSEAASVISNTDEGAKNRTAGASVSKPVTYICDSQKSKHLELAVDGHSASLNANDLVDGQKSVQPRLEISQDGIRKDCGSETKTLGEGSRSLHHTPESVTGKQLPEKVQNPSAMRSDSTTSASTSEPMTSFPGARIPAPSASIPGSSTGSKSSTGIPGSNSGIPGSSTSIPGPSTSIPGSGASIPGSAASIPGSGASVPGSSKSIPGSRKSIPGSGASIPGSSTNILGSSTSIPGSSTSVPGSGANVSGSSASIPGSSAIVPGSSTSIPGSFSNKPVPGAGIGPGTSTVAPPSTSVVPSTSAIPSIRTPPNQTSNAAKVSSKSAKSPKVTFQEKPSNDPEKSNSAYVVSDKTKEYEDQRKPRSFKGALETYDIVVQDFSMDEKIRIAKDLTKVGNIANAPLDEYSLAAVTKVRWNPNQLTHHWMMVAGKSGLVRLVNLQGAVNRDKGKLS